MDYLQLHGYKNLKRKNYQSLGRVFWNVLPFTDQSTRHKMAVAIMTDSKFCEKNVWYVCKRHVSCIEQGLFRVID